MQYSVVANKLLAKQRLLVLIEALFFKHYCLMAMLHWGLVYILPLSKSINCEVWTVNHQTPLSVLWVWWLMAHGLWLTLGKKSAVSASGSHSLEPRLYKSLCTCMYLMFLEPTAKSVVLFWMATIIASRGYPYFNGICTKGCINVAADIVHM